MATVRRLPEGNEARANIGIFSEAKYGLAAASRLKVQHDYSSVPWKMSSTRGHHPLGGSSYIPMHASILKEQLSLDVRCERTVNDTFARRWLEINQIVHAATTISLPFLCV